MCSKIGTAMAVSAAAITTTKANFIIWTMCISSTLFGHQRRYGAGLLFWFHHRRSGFWQSHAVASPM
jgi:hypothetical protein